VKLKRILRPEIEIKYVGVKGFFYALFAILKVGLIKKAHIEFEIKVTKHNCVPKRYWVYAIPKYKLKRVRKLSESEVQEND
jgi:hypothetical protein